MKNIILCGFMGSGKSTIGKVLAKKTGRKLVDIDRHIEEKAAMKISEIFELHGEETFRNMEREAVFEISKSSNLVIASGGGTLLTKENVEMFRDGGNTIVFLDVKLSSLRYRLKNDTHRPLLQTPNRNEVINKLYKERIDKYRFAADIRINANASVTTVVNRIREEIPWA